MTVIVNVVGATRPYYSNEASTIMLYDPMTASGSADTSTMMTSSDPLDARLSQGTTVPLDRA